MHLHVNRAARALVAVVAGLVSSVGMASTRSDDIASLRIVRLDIPKEARGLPREWRVKDANSPAAGLAAALRRCQEKCLVKFRAKYQVAATLGDGTGTTFLVLGEYVKVEGVSFRCREDVGALVDRLWSEASVAPR